MTYTGPISINQVFAYEPPLMLQHPDFGLHVRVTGLLYDPATATNRVRTLGNGQYEPTEDVFRRDYRPVTEPAEVGGGDAVVWYAEQQTAVYDPAEVWARHAAEGRTTALGGGTPTP